MSRRWWIMGSSVFAVVFTLSTYLLISRQLDQKLWGHLPLFQFSAAWLLFFFLTSGRTLTTRPGIKNYGLATCSALLLTLGFPPFPFPFLMLGAFVPLLVALHRTHGLRQKFVMLLHAFLLWNIWATFWVANTAYAAGIFANVVNALLMTLPVLLFSMIVRRLGASVGLVVFVSTWIAFEFLHMRWELYWPWLTLGNSLSSMPFGIQWYSYVGTLGGSLWILVSNHLGYTLYDSGNWKSASRWSVLLCWLLIPFIISVITYANCEDQGETIEVVSIQPNLEPHYEKFTYSPDRIVDRFIKLSASAVRDSTDYLLFPETSFSRVNLDRPYDNPSMRSLRSYLQEFPRLKLVTGLDGYRILQDSMDLARPTTRPVRTSSGETVYLEAYNCAIQMNTSGKLQESYKAMYVPGAEYFPFQKLLFFLQPLVDRLGGTSYGYRIRSKFDLFSSEQTEIAPSICYESIFGEFTSRFIAKGAQAIFIMTNDGWWDNTSGHKQHAAYARLRAIESRRSIARSANMGTCCFINQRGDSLQATAYGEPGAIRGKIALNDAMTFYTKWGDVLGRVSVFIAILMLLRAVVKKMVP
ncbi:MAG: apolipoprotein N-acyltransferase [Saprospiraceae bacterium]|nr:apolipoprotein N-acyltransferase [Saprospiraceae bacterium]